MSYNQPNQQQKDQPDIRAINPQPGKEGQPKPKQGFGSQPDQEADAKKAQGQREQQDNQAQSQKVHPMGKTGA